MKKKGFAVVVGICLVLALVAGACAQPTPTPTPTPTPVKPIELVVNSGFPKTVEYIGEQIVPALAAIEERSNGRIKIKAFYGGELYGPTEDFEALRKGAVDIMPQWTHQYYSTLDAFYSWPKVPFLLDSQEHLRTAWEEGLRDIFVKRLGDKFPEVIIIHDSLVVNAPSTGLAYVGKAPLLPDDLKGKKVRVSDEFEKSLFDAAGGAGVFMPMGDAYMALKTGVIDGAVSYSGSLEGMKWYEVTDGNVNMCLNIAANLGIANKSKWETIPPDLQKIISDTLYEYSEEYLNSVPERDTAIFKRVKEAAAPGYELHELTAAQRAEWRELSEEPVWKPWFELIGDDAEAVMAIIDKTRK